MQLFIRWIFFIFSFWVLKANAQQNELLFNQSPLKQYYPVQIGEIQSENSSNERSAAVMIANDNCAGAITLTVNGGCYTDSTNGATTQTGENTLPCGSSTFTQTVWYRFTATSSTMWVQLYTLRFSGSGAMWGPPAWTSAVYQSNTCLPASAPISCVNSNSTGSGDGVIENILSGLTVGATYYIQVGYRTGSGVNLVPTYCIQVGDQFTPNCNTCSNPCGAACGYTSTPTVSQVTSTCPPYQQRPVIEGAVADTQCYTFYAVNTTVSFNVIVNSTCGSGNVTGFTWNLYSSACGAAIQSGTLSNLTFTGLTIGQQYRYCYSFTTPSNCYHTAYYPYFVGASPLPVDLLSFTGSPCEKGICLEWSTASEVNNERFILERSYDGNEFSEIATINGAGTSSVRHDYSFEDEQALGNYVYYRLSQIDFDGTKKQYDPIVIKLSSPELKFIVSPNPATEYAAILVNNPHAKTTAYVYVIDLNGRIVDEKLLELEKGLNRFSISTENLENGIYAIKLISKNDLCFQRLEVLK